MIQEVNEIRGSEEAKILPKRLSTARTNL